MKQALLDNKDLMLKIEKMEQKMIGHEEDISTIFNALKSYWRPRQKRNGSRLASRILTKNNNRPTIELP
ncbi:MAG: hypothetical protein ABIX01_05620 [Chitinophagaceae bacterium]